jgi:hypothetical protein
MDISGDASCAREVRNAGQIRSPRLQFPIPKYFIPRYTTINAAAPCVFLSMPYDVTTASARHVIPSWIHKHASQIWPTKFAREGAAVPCNGKSSLQLRLAERKSSRQRANATD